MRILFSMLLAMALCASVAVAEPTAHDLYQQALGAIATGRTADARTLLDTLVAQHPQDELTPHALLKIGELAEAGGDFAAAIAAYRRLVNEFADQPPAQRAQRRLSRLDRGADNAEAPLQAFERIRQDSVRLGAESALSKMEAIVRDYPRFEGRNRVLLWVAEEQRRRKNFSAALRYYHELRQQYPGTHWAYLATVGWGQTQIELRDFAAARAVFANLARELPNVPEAAPTAAQYLRTLDGFLALQKIYWLCLAAALAGAGLLLAGTRWREIRPAQLLGAVRIGLLPSLVLAPIAVVLRAKPAVFVNSLFALWVSFFALGAITHLFLATRSLSARGRRLLAAGLVALALVVWYAAYYHAGLVNLLFDSMQYERKYGK